MERMRKNRANKGFTLIELVVVIAVIAVLAVLGTISVLNTLEKSRVSAAMSDMSTVKSAAMMEYSDTSFWAKGDAAVEGDAIVDLVSDPGRAGWEGPYMDREINKNPWKGDFKLVNDGSELYMTLEGVPAKSAQQIADSYNSSREGAKQVMTFLALDADGNVVNAEYATSGEADAADLDGTDNDGVVVLKYTITDVSTKLAVAPAVRTDAEDMEALVVADGAKVAVITMDNAGAGETLEVVSSDEAIATAAGDDATGNVTITPVAVGDAVVTVNVKDITGEVVRTLDITVQVDA
jgi:prepilin-type N-terminal cleavage/methylation domain-containing protein